MMADINRALEKSKLVAENEQLHQEETKMGYFFDNLIGKSAEMHEVYSLVQQVAYTMTTVLILGETGTGKELVARAIHYSGPRSEYPFIPVNCPAMAENLFESELFGHVKGAFTGATKDKEGLFTTAHKGTIFLDEIGALSLSLQAKLLRVLQEQEVRPVGGTKILKIDARVVAATNIDLKAAVAEGSFREDLYYRLNVILITLPPLRKRKEDIPLLATHFLKKYCQKKVVKGISSEAMRLLSEHNWPGNIRELENVIQRGVVMCKRDILSSEDLSKILQSDLEDIPSLEELRRGHLIKVLKKTKHNKSKTASILGMSRQHIYRLIEKHGLKQKEAWP